MTGKNTKQTAKQRLLYRVFDLIGDQDFIGAMEILDTDDIDQGLRYFIRGKIFADYGNPDRNDNLARDLFLQSIQTSNPPEGAFVELTRLEKNKTQAMRVLRKGLAAFPKSEAIYYRMLLITPAGKRMSVVKEIQEENVSSARIHYIYGDLLLGEAQHDAAINEFKKADFQDSEVNQIVECKIAFAYLELKQFKEAKKEFQRLADNDLSHQLNYCPQIGLSLIFLRSGNLSQAESLFEEVCETEELEPELVAPWTPVHFDFEPHLLEVIERLIDSSKNEIVVGRARGLRGIHNYSLVELEVEEVDADLVEQTESDLEYAAGKFPKNTVYFKYLIWLYSSNCIDRLKAWNCALQYALNCDRGSYRDLLSGWSFLEKTTKAETTQIVKTLKSRLTRGNYIGDDEPISRRVLPRVLGHLYGKKRYADIASLADLLNRELWSDTGCLFEIAYSYAAENRKEDAEHAYRLCLSDDDQSSAAYNNLGLLLEQKNSLEEAVSMFRNASKLDNEDDILERNLSRLEGKLKEQSEERYRLNQALEHLKTESPYIQRKLLDFYEKRRDDGLIVCSYKQLPSYLAVSALRAPEVIKSFLDKRYVLRVIDHDLETSSSVYRINPQLEIELEGFIETLRSEEGLLEICQKLNTKALAELGYDSNLINALASISSTDLRTMLERDLRENAITLLSGLYKSALVLSGSIIEALLMDKLSQPSRPKKYKGKPVNQLVLAELLDFAESENLIDSTLAHLSHGVRCYRNLIHPGVEQRQAIAVSKENADLAWSIVRKVIHETK